MNRQTTAKNKKAPIVGKTAAYSMDIPSCEANSFPLLSGSMHQAVLASGLASGMASGMPSVRAPAMASGMPSGRAPAMPSVMAPGWDAPSDAPRMGPFHDWTIQNPTIHVAPIHSSPIHVSPIHVFTIHVFTIHARKIRSPKQA